MTSCVILAAGLGSRLDPVTRDRPKCLLRLRGKTIVRHQLDLLHAYGIDDVTIVTGYLADSIREEVGEEVETVDYPAYASTNNLHTLHHARHLLDRDVIVLFSDLLMSPAIMEEAAGMEGAGGAVGDFALLVDTDQNLADTMRVQHQQGRLTDIGSHIPPERGHGNFIGMARYSASGALRLASELEHMVAAGGHENDYYTAALPRLAAAGQPIGVVPIRGAPWVEIDDERGYEAAARSDFYCVDP